MDPVTILYLIYAIIGIGIIIFIHELGHFLAAKKVGVRVERFSIGFDPPLFGKKLRLLAFKKGETEYVIGLIPLGGYVKLAGETGREAEGKVSSPPPDWLIAKPVGSRAIVFAAGAGFNILSAFFFFAIAFSLGVNFVSTQIGNVEPGSPAWKAGLQPGDRILEVDGKPITEFTELLLAIAFGEEGEPLKVRVNRGGEDLPPLEVLPEWNPALGFRTIGILTAMDSRVSGVDPRGAAAEAGIRKGDRIVGARLASVKLTDLPSFNLLSDALKSYANLHPGFLLEVLVEREGKPEWKQIRPKKRKEPSPSPMLGVRPSGLVKAVRPGSSAALHLEPGDRVLSVNGKPFVSLYWDTIQSIVPDPGTPVLLEVEGEDGRLRKEEADRNEAILWSVKSDIQWGTYRARIGSVNPDSSLVGGRLESGDTIVKIGSSRIESPEDVTSALSKEAGDMLEVRILRKGGRLQDPISLPRRILEEGSGLTWKPAPAVTVAPGMPAEQLGIEDGSRILSFDGKPIQKWKDLLAAVGEAGDKEVEVGWETPEGKRETGKTTLKGESYQPLGLAYQHLQVLRKAGVLESAVLGMRRTVIVAQNVFLTLKGLLRRQVAAKNLAGPVGIVHIIVRVSEFGLGTLIYWLALISVNLGILNLLPLPILDGGHLLFLLIEKLKGSPVDIRIQEIATTLAFFLIISLAIFVTYNDIMRLFGR